MGHGDGNLESRKYCAIELLTPEQEYVIGETLESGWLTESELDVVEDEQTNWQTNDQVVRIPRV